MGSYAPPSRLPESASIVMFFGFHSYGLQNMRIARMEPVGGVGPVALCRHQRVALGLSLETKTPIVSPEWAAASRQPCCRCIDDPIGRVANVHSASQFARLG